MYFIRTNFRADKFSRTSSSDLFSQTIWIDNFRGYLVSRT